MSRLHNQRRLFLDLVETLRPHWRRDRNLPARLQRWLSLQGAGSRDRRLYRELAYTAVRILPWIEQAPADELVGIVATCAAVTPATAPFVEAFRLPALPAGCQREQLVPAWLARECPAALEAVQLQALLERAPLWIRLQAENPARIAVELVAEGWEVTRSPCLEGAWRLSGAGDVTRTTAYQSGQIEVQDLGSQLLLPTVGPAAGERWLDACAGAGGKTLQLARLLGSSGAVVAHDVRPAALAELERRVQRAGLRNVRIERQPRGEYDGVLVDAPCTGSGTWRRAPHLKWTTTEDAIAEAAGQQLALLTRYAAQVAPGGRLVYATCSLCRTENEAVVGRFLEQHAAFAPETLRPPAGLGAGPLGFPLLPADVDSDAFFVSALRRIR